MSRADYWGHAYDDFYQINPQTGEVMQREPSGSRSRQIPEHIRQTLGLPPDCIIYVVDGRAVILQRLPR